MNSSFHQGSYVWEHKIEDVYSYLKPDCICPMTALSYTLLSLRRYNRNKLIKEIN